MTIVIDKLVKNNLGLCFVNRDFFKEELANGDVKEIKVKEQLFNDNVYIVYKNGKNINNVNKFINALKKQYKEEL